MNAPGAGRPRKPIEVHKRNGNPGHRPLPDAVPVPLGRPAPPPHYDEEHLAIWDFYVNAIDEMGVLSPNDAHAIEMMVDSWVAYRFMQSQVVAYGYTEDTKVGERIAAATKVREMMFKNTMQMLSQFGFTPVARANIAVASGKVTEETNPLVALWKKREGRETLN